VRCERPAAAGVRVQTGLAVQQHVPPRSSRKRPMKFCLTFVDENVARQRFDAVVQARVGYAFFACDGKRCRH